MPGYIIVVAVLLIVFLLAVSLYFGLKVISSEEEIMYVEFSRDVLDQFPELARPLEKFLRSKRKKEIADIVADAILELNL